LLWEVWRAESVAETIPATRSYAYSDILIAPSERTAGWGDRRPQPPISIESIRSAPASWPDLYSRPDLQRIFRALLGHQCLWPQHFPTDICNVSVVTRCLSKLIPILTV